MQINGRTLILKLMATAKELFPFILKYEGGWSNHPADRGGQTNMGITLRTWKSCGYDKDEDGDIDADDLRMISEDNVFDIFKKNYWDRWKGDDIVNQDIANILVDWVWLSGKHAITITQELLGVKPDGIVGAKTLGSLNNMDMVSFFYEIKNARIEFIENIIKRTPSQSIFRRGWMNRLNAIEIGM